MLSPGRGEFVGSPPPPPPQIGGNSSPYYHHGITYAHVSSKIYTTTVDLFGNLSRRHRFAGL